MTLAIKAAMIKYAFTAVLLFLHKQISHLNYSNNQILGSLTVSRRISPLILVGQKQFLALKIKKNNIDIFVQTFKSLNNFFAILETEKKNRVEQKQVNFTAIKV